MPDPEEFEKIASCATDACSTCVDTSDLNASNSPWDCTRDFCTERKRDVEVVTPFHFIQC